MRIFRSFEEARVIHRPVVTTGSFDGVHIGHKTILNRLKMLADKYGGESVLITFDPHPRKVLYPDTAGKDLKLINSHEEKLILLERSGLGNVIIINFTLEFSRIKSEEFVRDMLHGTLGAKVIVVGFNHHFGFNQEGDYRQLWNWREKYGFDAEEIPEQEVYNETVSSTRIRLAISEGYIQRANAYLDHFYFIRGPLHRSHGTEFGGADVYSIGIAEHAKIVPPPGIYAVSAEFINGSSKGMAVIRKNTPPAEVIVELFDKNNHEQGTSCNLYFHKKITGAINPGDTRANARISSAREEISELIY